MRRPRGGYSERSPSLLTPRRQSCRLRLQPQQRPLSRKLVQPRIARRRPTAVVACTDYSAACSPSGDAALVAGKIAIIVVGVVVGLVLLGALIPAEDEEPASSAAPTTTTTQTEQEPTSADRDTGRMSDTEYEEFSAAQSDFADEALQFSEEIQKCSVIGLAGQLAEFSSCTHYAYGGVQDSAEYAYFISDDTLDDVAKRCRVVLRNYMSALDNLNAKMQAVERAGSLLQFEELTAASKQLPGPSQRYSRAALNALTACSPT